MFERLLEVFKAPLGREKKDEDYFFEAVKRLKKITYRKKEIKEL